LHKFAVNAVRGSRMRSHGERVKKALRCGVMPPKDEGSTSGLQTVGNYTLLETIGNGTFGEVMLAVERHTRESVAVKILEKDKIVDEDARTRLMNEIAILHRVQHPKVLHLLEVVESVDAIYLITEYVAGGELFQYIVQHGRLEEAEAVKLFSQLVAAVDSCHRSHVIHRDLKPENVLLDADGNIKLIDFGLGTILGSSDEVLQVACGSPHYAAPEMLLGNGYLGQRIDMWSLGVCLCAARAIRRNSRHSSNARLPPHTTPRRYAMVCGCLPFDEPDMDVLYDRIIAGDYDFSPAPRLSPDVRHLIRGLLHMPPEQRLTARQVMGHRWLRSVAAPPAMSLGLLGAVVDPACRQLLRTLEAECELVPREVRRRAAQFGGAIRRAILSPTLHPPIYCRCSRRSAAASARRSRPCTSCCASANCAAARSRLRRTNCSRSRRRRASRRSGGGRCPPTCAPPPRGCRPSRCRKSRTSSS
jgi:serine/threonine protein kinase